MKLPRRPYAVENQFLRRAVAELKDSGIRCDFRDVAWVRPGATGKLVIGERRLVVAVCSELWWETFVHEYCHFRQWREGMWVDITPDYEFECWLEGENYRPQRVLATVRTIQACERDAERRTRRILRRFPSSDIDKHAQESNLLLYAWEAARQRRKLHSVQYRSYRSIMSKMPARILSRHDVLPAGFLDWYDSLGRNSSVAA